MNKRVILLTNVSMSLDVEDFLGPEIMYSNGAVELDIVALNLTKKKVTDRGGMRPDRSMVKLLFNKPLSIQGKIILSLKSLTMPRFWREIFFLISKRRLKFRKFLSAMTFCAYSERIYLALNKHYKEILVQHPRDVVVYSFWLGVGSYAAARLAEKYGCAAISRAHGGDLYEERYHINYLPMRGYMLDKLNGCFPISNMGCKYLNEKYGQHNNIDCSYLGTSDYGERSVIYPAQPFVIISCAYMYPLKRVPLLAEALSNIHDIKIKWIHFGGGEDFDQVEKITRTLPDNVSVQLMGNTMHGEIIQYYSTHDVNLFVNTSTSEGIPISIMEAMSFGIPVIATDVGGTGELVIDGINGYLVSTDITPSQLAEKIGNFLFQPEDKMLQMRKQTRERWREHFNADRNYSEFYGMPVFHNL